MRKAGKEIKALFRLLDDDDDSIVCQALSALLNYPDQVLNKHIKELQETPNELLRRHIHQLESIMLMRRRRHELAVALRDDNTDLLTGLINIHLQWFDIDNPAALEEMVTHFYVLCDQFKLNSLAQLADYFIRNDFEVPQLHGIPFPDLYCLGVVLEERRGDDAVLGILAKLVAARHQFSLQIGRCMGSFVLVDAKHQMMLTPERNWQISPIAENVEYYKNNELLRYIMQRLFTYSVETDSFRYVHTLSTAITGRSDSCELDYLPYPFFKKR